MEWLCVESRIHGSLEEGNKVCWGLVGNIGILSILAQGLGENGLLDLGGSSDVVSSFDQELAEGLLVVRFVYHLEVGFLCVGVGFLECLLGSSGIWRSAVLVFGEDYLAACFLHFLVVRFLEWLPLNSSHWLAVTSRDFHFHTKPLHCQLSWTSGLMGS